MKQWLNSRAGPRFEHTPAPSHLCRYAGCVLGQRLISDIGEEDIASLMRDRERRGFKPRRINFELALLRMVLTHFGVWGSVKGRIRLLGEPHDVGRAISRED